MLRKARVAGQFYPGDPAELKESLRDFMGREKGPEKEKDTPVALIAPHAGYIYSGGVAGAVYAAIKVPDNVLLIGPNHTGLGERAAVMDEGQWETPLGITDINEELAEKVVASCALFSTDPTAHLGEHSLEVQLPFIQELNPGARIVPLTVMPASIKSCEEMGEAIADVLKDYPEKVLIAVSSDMNHYEPDKITREKDKLALDKVLKLDAEGLLNITGENDITMCGVVPTAIAITAAKRLGAKEAELVKYATSGETSGDYNHVVGYAGIVIK
ncbi:MAG: AmmeMemoRadiSam system protein B [Thermodesulfobacteriota bacterium]